MAPPSRPARGQVTALIGDNGAGKSTLVKYLSGARSRRPAGSCSTLRSAARRPVAAWRLGIETVYQDLAVAPELDPAASLFLGREIHRNGVLGKLGLLDRAAHAKRLQGRLKNHPNPKPAEIQFTQTSRTRRRPRSPRRRPRRRTSSASSYEPQHR